MNEYPAPDESFDHLHEAGWCVGEIRPARNRGWRVIAVRWGVVIDVHGSSRAETWARAAARTHSLGPYVGTRG
jgi:hypothetical protein